MAITHEEHLAAAQEFVKTLSEKRFPACVETFDAVMKGQMPELVLEQTWGQLVSQVGEFKSRGDGKAIDYDDLVICLVTCEFDRMPLNVRVVYNPAGEVAGLGFEPVQGG